MLAMTLTLVMGKQPFYPLSDQHFTLLSCKPNFAHCKKPLVMERLFSSRIILPQVRQLLGPPTFCIGNRS